MSSTFGKVWEYCLRRAVVVIAALRTLTFGVRVSRRILGLLPTLRTAPRSRSWSPIRLSICWFLARTSIVKSMRRGRRSRMRCLSLAPDYCARWARGSDPTVLSSRDSESVDIDSKERNAETAAIASVGGSHCCGWQLRPIVNCDLDSIGLPRRCDGYADSRICALAQSSDRATERPSRESPRCACMHRRLWQMPLAASAQGPLGSLQPSVRPSSRSSPRHRVSVPGSPSDLRPRNPPCLAVMRMASRKLGAGASGGRFLNLIS